MRIVLASITAGLVVGLASGFAIHEAAAVPKVDSAKVATGLIQDVAGKRYSRRHGDLAMTPRARRLPPAAPVTAAPRTSRVAVLGPGSCGEFKFWDGTRCVDRRYMEKHFK
jgi:hypothetical protein